MKRFVEGEWVKQTLFSRERFGWVTETIQGNFYSVVYVKFLDSNSEIKMEPDRLESYEEVLPEVREETKKIFVELALMTRDRDWFMDVTG